LIIPETLFFRIRERIGFFYWVKTKEVSEMKNGNGKKARLIAMISRDEMDFIDRIGKDALFSTGHKLSRTEVVSAILDAVAQLPISGRNIHSKAELHDYIIQAIEAKANERGK
jgi:hypothetical protein